MRLRLTLTLLLALAGVTPAAAAAAENARVERLFESVRSQPARLRVFLHAMPKGGDLHHHLWGAPYAEHFLDEAGKTGLCVRKDGMAIVPPPCDPAGAVPTVAAAGLNRRDPILYATALNALSMRGYVTGPQARAVAGHDRFFATFDRFGAIAARAPGRLLADARDLAGGDGVIYIETQQNPGASMAAGALALSRKVPVDDPAAAYRLIAPDLPHLVADARAETDRTERDAATLLGCDPAASSPACAVTVRFQAFALRGSAPETVFGQLALAFALADADSRYVGVNIVSPEDGPVALADYDRHMAMLRYLSSRYPKVPMSLHAGELSLGLVPPAALRDHIMKAVDAGAKRIGHGVDISYEADAPRLLARMKRDRIAVEINLTSNDSILGVRGRDHPLALYRAAGVPVVLATDDEGVSRSDMTNEYLRAVTEQGLGYADLKAISRSSITYSFLPGASLWQAGRIGMPVDACRAADPATSPPSTCQTLIAGSQKAQAEWRLERAFFTFERGIGGDPF